MLFKPTIDKKMDIYPIPLVCNLTLITKQNTDATVNEKYCAISIQMGY